MEERTPVLSRQGRGYSKRGCSETRGRTSRGWQLAEGEATAMTVCPVGQEASRLPQEARLEWMQPHRDSKARLGWAGPGGASGWGPKPQSRASGMDPQHGADGQSRPGTTPGCEETARGALASAVGGWDANPVLTRSPAPGPAQANLGLLPGRRDSGQVTPRSELGSLGGNNQQEQPQAMLEHFLYASVHTGCRGAGGRDAEAQRGGSATQHEGGSPAGAREEQLSPCP